MILERSSGVEGPEESFETFGNFSVVVNIEMESVLSLLEFGGVVEFKERDVGSISGHIERCEDVRMNGRMRF